MAHDILKLLDKLTPKVRRAFLQSIADIKSEAQLAVIISAIDRGDVESALRALNLKPEFFAPLDDALRAAYMQGGAAALAGLPRLPDPFPAGAWLRASMDAIQGPSAGCLSSPRV